MLIMKIKLDAADKIFGVMSLLFFITNILIVAFSIGSLPDIVPTHFNFKGEPNDYSSKNTLWAIPVLSGFIYMLTGLITGNPELYNYPSQKIDKEAMYKLGSKLMRSLRAWILFFIAIITFMVVQAAKTGTAKGSVWLLLFIFAIIAGHLIWFFVQWKKIN